jgi:hypothetical protein
LNISHQVDAAPATIEMLFCFCLKERFVPPKIRNSITERSLSFLQSTFAIRPFASFKFDNFQRGQTQRTKKASRREQSRTQAEPHQTSTGNTTRPWSYRLRIKAAPDQADTKKLSDNDPNSKERTTATETASNLSPYKQKPAAPEVQPVRPLKKRPSRSGLHQKDPDPQYLNQID